jgi:hypothetical protein
MPSASSQYFNEGETMSNPHAVPTVRVKAETEGGFAIINAVDFDHDAHELFDKKDKHLVPERPRRVTEAEAADIEGLRKALGEAEDRALEAESERDEWKGRAEAAEKQIAEMQGQFAEGNDKKGGKGKKDE